MRRSVASDVPSRVANCFRVNPGSASLSRRASAANAVRRVTPASVIAAYFAFRFTGSPRLTRTCRTRSDEQPNARATTVSPNVPMPASMNLWAVSGLTLRVVGVGVGVGVGAGVVCVSSVVVMVSPR